MFVIVVSGILAGGGLFYSGGLILGNFGQLGVILDIFFENIWTLPTHQSSSYIPFTSRQFSHTSGPNNFLTPSQTLITTYAHIKQPSNSHLLYLRHHHHRQGLLDLQRAQTEDAGEEETRHYPTRKA